MSNTSRMDEPTGNKSVPGIGTVTIPKDEQNPGSFNRYIAALGGNVTTN